MMWFYLPLMEAEKIKTNLYLSCNFYLDKYKQEKFLFYTYQYILTNHLKGLKDKDVKDRHEVVDDRNVTPPERVYWNAYKAIRK